MARHIQKVGPVGQHNPQVNNQGFNFRIRHFHEAGFNESSVNFLALLHHLAGKARIHLAEINIIFHQMIDVAVQKAVSPQLAAQDLKITDFVIGIQRAVIRQREHFQSFLLVLLHQLFDNFAFISKMIIQIPRAHPQFSCNMIGRNRTLAALIKQQQAELQNTFFCFQRLSLGHPKITMSSMCYITNT